MDTLVDWKGMKYRIEEIPPSEFVVDRFPDLRANRDSFMDGAYSKRPDGIPDEYDVDDWILRYIILLDSPRTPADLIPDLMEKKVWALRILGVGNPSQAIKDIVFFRDKIFNVRRVLFLRLQYNGFYMIAKQLESELVWLSESEMPKTEQESVQRQNRMKVLMANIQENASKFLNNDSNAEMEEALMALVTNDNMNRRPEQFAPIYAGGNDPFPNVSIFTDKRIDA